MALADRLATPTNSNRCKLGDLIDRLAPADRDALTAALGNLDGYSSTSIVAALRSEGHRIGTTVVRGHRKGECSCVAG